MNEYLENWYLDGTVLYPTPHHLREHVTALSNFHHASALQFHFSDNRTITIHHAQLSASPLNYLLHLTHITVESSSEAFDTIRKFIYCTPIDLSGIPCQLVKASYDWRLYELHAACFLVAETAHLEIVQLIEKYIPLSRFTHLPERFKYYFAGRIAVDAADLRGWIRRNSALSDRKSNKHELQRALEEGLVIHTVRRAMRLYSELDEADILSDTAPRTSCDGKNVFGLVWRLPLAHLLASGQEYVETERFAPDVAACMEIAWSAGGMAFVVGVLRVEGSGLVDVSAAAIGLPCECAHRKHNTGWELYGGVKARSRDWIVRHEVAFTVFDDAALREWRKVHKDCGLLVKVRVAVEDLDTDADANGDADETSDVDTSVDADGDENPFANATYTQTKI